MPLPYYQLLGHMIAAAHGCEESAELTGALEKAGFSRDAVASLSRLAHQGEMLVGEKLAEIGEDRIQEHSAHAATYELEMWMQTGHYLVKKGVSDDALVARVRAEDLHAEEHAATAIARALRFIAMARADERVQTGIGDTRKIRDLLTRGQSLLKKLYKATEIRLAPERNNADASIFARLEDHRALMTKTLVALDDAAQKIAPSNLALLGPLGYVPEGYGVPVGGASYAVLLHERGQSEPPDPRDVKPCTGWSIGRQGRNRENLGKGFIEPTFEK